MLSHARRRSFQSESFPKLAFFQALLLKRTHLLVGVTFLLVLVAFCAGLRRVHGFSSRQANESQQHEIDFAYYSLREGFSSTLLLVSDSPAPTDFSVSLHNRSGQTLVASPQTIQPHEKQAIDLGSLVRSLSSEGEGDFSEGNVSVSFTSVTRRPLVGQITISNLERHLSLQSEMFMNDPMGGSLPSALNGMWWGLGGNREATIAVTNTAGNSAVADVFLDFHGKRQPAAPLYFDPHETKVLSIRDLLEQIGEHPSTMPEGGISIIPRGPLPTLIAQGMMMDPTTGFSTTLNFPSPDSQRASALHASGVPLGKPSNDSPYAGAGTFIPHAVVRNLTASVENITVTIEYPGPQGPQQVVLAPFSLEGFSTKDVALDSFFNLLPSPLPFGSIRIQYDGPAGSVLAEVSSVEQKGDLVVDSRVANEGDSWASSGANPWHLDAETESVLFLTNMGESVSRVGVQVQADGISYHLTKVKLQPHETRAIDLRQLRDAQQADFQGNKIPPAATEGSILWIRQDAVPLMGRLLVMNQGRGMAGSYNCQICPCCPNFTGVTVNPASDTLLPGGTSQMTATETQTDCNGTNFFSDITSQATWSSSNTSVATVGSPNPAGLVTAVNPGSATVTAAFTDVVFPLAPSGFCSPRQMVTKSGSATCNIDSLVFSITSGSVPGDPLGVIAKAPFNLQIQAKSPSGVVPDPNFIGNRTLILVNQQSTIGEAAPSSVSFSSGTANASITAVAASGSDCAPSSVRQINIGPAGISNTVFFFNVYWQVTMDVERWKNCNFTMCPNKGSYFCMTAYTPSGFIQPTSFISLPYSKTCLKGIGVVVNQQATTIQDAGPTTTDNYWFTGSFPSIGGCLTDVLATALGISNGCQTQVTPLCPNPPCAFGGGTVSWRFGQ